MSEVIPAYDQPMKLYANQIKSVDIKNNLIAIPLKYNTQTAQSTEVIVGRKENNFPVYQYVTIHITI